VELADLDEAEVVGQDFILQPVFNRPLVAEQRASKTAA
jgi:hypothetical protein